MSWLVYLNVILFIILMSVLYWLKHRGWSLSYRVFVGLIIGSLFGVILQKSYGVDSQVVKDSLQIIGVVGSGYVQFLQMLIYPLVLIFVLSAVAKLQDTASLGKIAGFGIGTLLLTTAISALIGALLVAGFNLSASGIIGNTTSPEQLANLASRVTVVQDINISQWALSFIPKNPFSDLTGARPSSIIAVAIFAIMLGLSVLRLRKTKPELADKLVAGIELFQQWITQLIRLVMEMTPYGVLALIIKVVAGTNAKSLADLVDFLLLSYLGLLLILLVHAIIIFLVGLKPKQFFIKAWPALIFAFTSRSSAATIPLNVEIQTKQMGFPNSIASFIASFGATIGQNGCAGLYPAMLAAMVAPVVGINPLDPVWLVTLVLITTLSSIGIAGVGGGATFAALLVLPILGLPIEIIPILIAVEPIIDMGRTAVNVSGTMVAGAVTSQALRQTNITCYNKKSSINSI